MELGQVDQSLIFEKWIKMDEITKADFLSNFKSEFKGNDKNGYDYCGYSIPEKKLKDVTNHSFATLDEIENIIENRDENEDEYSELNNSIMAHIFGDGDEFQGSYEEEEGSGDYCWYLDFGDIEIDQKNKCLNYKGVRFYKG